MSLNRTVIEAPPSRVFEVLLDPEAYATWVVGTQSIRGWDKDWPHVGACFHHRVGSGPWVIEDSSEVMVLDPDRRLVLEVRIRPLGIALVDMTLESIGPERATLVTFTETTTGGFLRTLPAAVVHPLLWARNGLSLRRLARLSEGRHALATAAPGEVAVGRA